MCQIVLCLLRWTPGTPLVKGDRVGGDEVGHGCASSSMPAKRLSGGKVLKNRAAVPVPESSAYVSFRALSLCTSRKSKLPPCLCLTAPPLFLTPDCSPNTRTGQDGWQEYSPSSCSCTGIA